MTFGRELNWGGSLKFWKNKAEKFAKKNSPSKFAENFAGNFPKIRQTKIKNSTQNPLCRTSGSKNVIARLFLCACGPATEPPNPLIPDIRKNYERKLQNRPPRVGPRKSEKITKKYSVCQFRNFFYDFETQRFAISFRDFLSAPPT